MKPATIGIIAAAFAVVTLAVSWLFSVNFGATYYRPR